MIKTHPKSYFAHKSLDGMQKCGCVVLQAEKTDSTYRESKETVYLCELVDWRHYNPRCMEELAAEVLRQNKEIRRLQNKIAKLERKAPVGME